LRYHPIGQGLKLAEEANMRALVLVSLTLATMALTQTAADAGSGSWCATYSKRGVENCTYTSFEQCRASVWGVGGFCRPNPFPGTAFGTGGTWGSPPKRGY
jgi:Protein of unknown function (DUF3551)